MVVCEKPLAMNVAEAEEMVAAVEKAGVANMVSFNYRRVPAISLAKQIIDEGRVGRPFHYRATYNQDYTISADVPQGGMALWRLDAKVAGSGVTGDLLAHSIDTAEWLNGPIQRVTAPHGDLRQAAQARRDRQGRAGRHRRRLHVPGLLRQRLDGHLRDHPLRPRPQELQHLRAQRRDTARSISTWKTRTSSSISSTPIPRPGQKIEDHLTGWQRIHVTNFEHPYMKNWWVPGCTIGYEHTFINGLADFLAGLEGGPTFAARHAPRPADPAGLRRGAPKRPTRAMGGDTAMTNVEIRMT